MKKSILYDEKGDLEDIINLLAIIIFLVITYFFFRFIISIPAQTLVILIVIFMIYRIHSKSKEITYWIQPFIYSQDKDELFKKVLLKLFKISQFYNMFNCEIKNISKLTERLKDSENEVTKISNSINHYNEQILKIEHNSNGELSAASKLERIKLEEKKDSLIKKLRDIEEESSRSQIFIEEKNQKLSALIEVTRFAILADKNDDMDKVLEELQKIMERNAQIKKLIEETRKSIIFNIKRIDEGYIKAALISLDNEIKGISEDYRANRLSSIDALEQLIEIKSDVNGLIKPQKTYYDILGVDPKASTDTIRQKYREKQLEYHPDRQPPGSRAWVREYSEEMSKKLNEIIITLTDPKKRREYDIEIGIIDPSEEE